MKITDEQQAEMDHRPLPDVQYVIVHHSVAAQTLDIEQIQQMEKVAQNFVAVGYHAYIRKNPDTGKWEIQEGRTIDDVPAAAYGLNEPSYDICIAGNYQDNVQGVPTDSVDHVALYLAIQRIIAVKSKCPNLDYLIGHFNVAQIMAKRGKNPGDFSTDCPGNRLIAHLGNLRAATALHSPPELL